MEDFYGIAITNEEKLRAKESIQSQNTCKILSSIIL